MKEKKETLPHGYFNHDIYLWTLSLPFEEWKSIKPKKMSAEEFVNCIKYLICCGEPLELSEDLSAFKRIDIERLDFTG